MAPPISVVLFHMFNSEAMKNGRGKLLGNNYLGSGGAIKVRSLGTLLGGDLTCEIAVGRSNIYCSIVVVIVFIGRR